MIVIASRANICRVMCLLCMSMAVSVLISWTFAYIHGLVGHMREHSLQGTTIIGLDIRLRPTNARLEAYEYGWPFRCMEYHVVLAVDSAHGQTLHAPWHLIWSARRGMMVGQQMALNLPLSVTRSMPLDVSSILDANGSRIAIAQSQPNLIRKTERTFDIAIENGLLFGPSTFGTEAFAIPLKPIWSGLGLNALIYLSVSAVLMFIHDNLVFRTRMRRGVCPLCQHILYAQPASGCPECGWNRKKVIEQPQNRNQSQADVSHG